MSQDLARDLRFRRSIRKSVSSYPRSVPVPHILDDVTHMDVTSFQVISQCVAASLLF